MADIVMADIDMTNIVMACVASRGSNHLFRPEQVMADIVMAYIVMASI